MWGYISGGRGSSSSDTCSGGSWSVPVVEKLVVGRWWRWIRWRLRRCIPGRRNPEPLDAAYLVAALAAQQGSRVKAAALLEVLLRRPDTGSAAVHRVCASGRGEGWWWSV